ncbi:MAG: LCP family protein [Clostridia bacterium]|nr:LCP family protein [Clostridia bacterium]
MKRIAFIAFILLISICTLSLSGCTSGVIDAWNDLKRDDRAYLVVGLDEANNNTDVILLVSVRDGEVSVLQIPRDTYYSDGNYTGKINGIYPTLIASGMKENAALERLAELIGTTLGVKIDGSAALRSSFVPDVTDRVGGIDIELSEGVEITRPDGSILALKKGTNHLDGEDVLLLVRHRASYLSGDLGRMDMQKIVLSALVRAMQRELDMSEMLSLAFDNRKNIITNFDFADIYNILIKNLGRNNEPRICYATLPGTSERLDDGLWYYFISKNASTELFVSLGIGTDLDAEEKLLAKGKENLYYEKEIKPRIYYNDDLSDIRIN